METFYSLMKAVDCAVSDRTSGGSFDVNVVNLAAKSNITPLLYGISDCFEEDYIKRILKTKAEECIKFSYYQAYISRYLIRKLDEADAKVALLKGTSLAVLYPYPELRPSSDIDLFLLEKADKEKAIECLKDIGCLVNSRQDSNHHISLNYDNQIEIELHIEPVRAFELDWVNEKISKAFTIEASKLETITCYGMKFPVLPAYLNGFYLLLHMLQHYMNSGLELKLLVDFSVFWRSIKDLQCKASYLELVNELEISSFSDLVCECCLRYIGGGADDYPFYKRSDKGIEVFMNDIFDSLSKTNNERVLVARDTSFIGLVKEFHHQTRENYPQASKCFLFWPILWIMTLIRFIRNNKKVRNTSTFKVLKSSVKRGDLLKEIELWQKI